jgi:hypothetical protein
MRQANGAGLEIVFRNPTPRRELTSSTTWLLFARDHKDLRISVSRNGLSRPRIIRRGAA